VKSVPNPTKVVSLNLIHGEVYSIQHYMIKFASHLQQVGCFPRVLCFPPPIKLTQGCGIAMLDLSNSYIEPAEQVDFPG